MKTPKPLNDLIKQSNVTPALSQYLAKSGEFDQIKQIVTQVVGSNIAQNIIVSNYKNAIVYLETISPAVSTAFKMYHSATLSALRSQFSAGVASIEIKVSPKTTRVSKLASPTKALEKQPAGTRQLPESAQRIFTEMAERCDGDLRQKLLKLTSKIVDK